MSSIPTPKINMQEYENHTLCGSSVEQNAAENGDRLFNAKLPNLGIQHEKAEHRMVIYLKAQALSNREIAKRLGYTDAWVSQILRQPWAREQLLKEIQLAGREPIQTLLASSAEDSVYRLIELRDQKDELTVARAAADSLLDRFLGKATQRVESKSTVQHVSGDIEEVNRELQELEAEERRLTGTATRN